LSVTSGISLVIKLAFNSATEKFLHLPVIQNLTDTSRDSDGLSATILNLPLFARRLDISPGNEAVLKEIWATQTINAPRVKIVTLQRIA